MNLTQIALACASALVTSMAAQAVSPAGPYDTVGAMRVFMYDDSGNGAITNNKILESLLKPGFYRYTAGVDYHLYLGESIATAPVGTIGFPVNQKILFINRTKIAPPLAVFPFNCLPLQTMILNSSVCPTAAVAGGSARLCTNSAIVGNDPGVLPPTGQEVTPDFVTNLLHPYMFSPPLNTPFGFGGGGC